MIFLVLYVRKQSRINVIRFWDFIRLVSKGSSRKQGSVYRVYTKTQMHTLLSSCLLCRSVGEDAWSLVKSGLSRSTGGRIFCPALLTGPCKVFHCRTELQKMALGGVGCQGTESTGRDGGGGREKQRDRWASFPFLASIIIIQASLSPVFHFNEISKAQKTRWTIIRRRLVRKFIDATPILLLLLFLKKSFWCKLCQIPVCPLDSQFKPLNA